MSRQDASQEPNGRAGITRVEVSLRGEEAARPPAFEHEAPANMRKTHSKLLQTA